MRKGAADTIWLMVGVVLLLFIMASFAPSSPMSSAFMTMKTTVSEMFGGGTMFCPFINPYAIQLFSSGEIIVSGSNSFCDPVEYVLCSESSASFDEDDEIGGFKCDSGDGYGTVFVDDGQCVNTADPPEVEIYSVKVGEENNVIIEPSNRPNTIELTNDEFLAYMNSYAQTYGEDIKENKVAVQLMSQKIPPWQCFVIYGLLPFLIIYYILNDILMFAYFRSNTRRVIALFASLLAIMTGAFAQVIVAISGFTGLAIGSSFLMMIFSLAILAVLLGQFTVTAGVAASTTQAVQQAVTGALSLAAVARSFNQGKQEEK
ncbi:MAG: hypothetical protein GOU99_03385 [Candidatus Altiarchaeota archaeon]|nr:hypothetical protein [Candidatus Altiarchaeota archaeon]